MSHCLIYCHLVVLPFGRLLLSEILLDTLTFGVPPFGKLLLSESLLSFGAMALCKLLLSVIIAWFLSFCALALCKLLLNESSHDVQSFGALAFGKMLQSQNYPPSMRSNVHCTYYLLPSAYRGSDDDSRQFFLSNCLNGRQTLFILFYKIEHSEIKRERR